MREDLRLADTSEAELERKRLLKEKKVLLKELDRATKNYNVIMSNNTKKRGQINALRKERTLYDHIFRTLEYQILDIEKKLNKSLIQNRTKNESLTEANLQYENIKELVSKSIHEEFHKVIEREKEKYTQNLEELRNSKELFRKTGRKKKKSNMTISSSNKISVINTDAEEERERIEINTKIAFLENLKDEFKYHTEEEDIDTLLVYLKEGEKLNESLYVEFSELENELEELNNEHKINLKLKDKNETQSVSTMPETHKEVNEMDDVVSEEDLHKQFNDSTKELNDLIVS